jgi:DTW domain-containing protein YfiP
MKIRCPRCRLHQELCVCQLLPRLETRTRVVLIMHAQEEPKPTNTGRLAHLCLPNSEIRLSGTPDRKPLDLSGLIDETHETWMLHLSHEASELDPSMIPAKPIRLVVPDGTWSQASRLGSKLAKALPGARHVMLKPDRPSNYRLRSEHDPNGLATFEAIARALEILEGGEVRREMEKLFQIAVDRMLWTRGQLATHEVTGGIPGKN